MSKNHFFFSLLLVCFLLSPCDSPLVALPTSSLDDPFISLIPDNSTAIAPWRQEEIANPIQQANLAKKGDALYILYARPNGKLGKQLSNYWKAVKDKKLNNPAVLDYPPHVTLTGFFPVDHPDDPEEEQMLIDSLQAALRLSDIIPIAIAGKSIKTSGSLDYIPIQNSPALKAVSLAFLEGAGIDASFIRPKPNSHIGYHISLRENPVEKITQKELKQLTSQIRKLENKYIDLKAPHLQENTGWDLYIYKKTEKKLEIIYKQPITTQ